MTPEFLEHLIKLYPNDQVLGQAVRRFWELKRSKPNLSIVELENEFTRGFQFRP